MTNFHACLRDILEDTFLFLSNSLRDEVLSSVSLTHKETLLSRLKYLQSAYPGLQLQFCVSEERKSDLTRCSTSSSPLPYVDMNGCSSQYKIPFFPPNDKESYDIVMPKERCDLENQSIAESEDYGSDDAKFLPDVAASDLYACEKSGYLDKKKRESIKGWLNPFQKRWCAIKEGVLYYFEKTSDRKQRGNIILAGYEVRTLLDDGKDGKKYNHCFELVCPGKRTYQFSAASEKDLQQWISAVERNSAITSLGRSSMRESQSFPNSPKSIERDPGQHIAEDIYETVDEDELEKQNVNVSAASPNPTANEVRALPVFEESSQDKLFNYTEYYVGLWDCSASDDSELSFYRGDVINIISKEYDSYAWWIGELGGKVGFVPKSYLMEAYESY